MAVTRKVANRLGIIRLISIGHPVWKGLYPFRPLPVQFLAPHDDFGPIAIACIKIGCVVPVAGDLFDPVAMSFECFARRESAVVRGGSISQSLVTHFAENRPPGIGLILHPEDDRIEPIR
jgi:hypothetical protein